MNRVRRGLQQLHDNFKLEPLYMDAVAYNIDHPCLVLASRHSQLFLCNAQLPWRLLW